MAVRCAIIELLLLGTLSSMAFETDRMPGSVVRLDEAGFKREVTDFAGVVVLEVVAQG
jgi:hypothetical protein